MDSSLELEIRRRLAEVARGEIELEAFEAWFIPATWGMDEALVHEIQMELAEFSHAALPKNELLARLAAHARTYKPTATVVTYSSSSPTVRTGVTYQRVWAGTQRAEASG